MSGLYMLSVPVVVAAEAADSDVPWVAGVEDSVAVIHEYDRAGLPGSLSSISDGAGVRGSHIQHP